MTRRRITEPLQLGIRAIDGCLTMGKGQRLGIFAGSGVGKSTILGMIARNTEADVNVICLVGERGREVREFIESDLGEEGLRRSRGRRSPRRTSSPAGPPQGPAGRHQHRRVFPRPGQGRDADDGLGDAPGDGPARGRPGRRRAARDARLPPLGLRPAAQDLGAVRHQRPRGRSPPCTPSWWKATTRTNRSPTPSGASWTATSGSPRDLAARGHYPAIEVGRSVSRVMSQVTPHRPPGGGRINCARRWRPTRMNEDLINIGAYEDGSNPRD